MIFIPKLHILATRVNKNLIFYHFWHIVGLWPTTMGLRPNKKKFHMTFEDMVKLFYFMTFIPKLHILATRGQKSGFFTIFGTLLAFGPPLWPFSPKKKVSHDL